MNKIIANFRGMNGRLNRQPWWIGVIILAVIGFILSWILGLILGTSVVDITNAASVSAYVQKAGWVGVIASVILAYPYLAITVKRRHDRNNNGYDAMGLIALSIVWNLLTALGVLSAVGGVGQIVSVIIGIYAIYILVVVGFLKGTAGPNNYGPDPLQG